MLCRNFWTKAFPFAVGIVFLLAMTALAFGDSQWNKWIYIFQAYVFPGKGVIYINDDNYTGIWYYWWPNGQMQGKEEYLNGDQNGKEIQWYQNGQIKAERMYKFGEQNSRETEWYENGQKKAERQYEQDGAFCSIEWYKNGKLKKIAGYSIKGYSHVSIRWSLTGIKSEEFIDQNRSIMVKALWSYGRLFSLCTWDLDSKPFGRHLTYGDNMQITEEISFHNGLKEGFASEWYDSGKKKAMVPYHRGKRNGWQYNWDECGILSEITHYKDDKRCQQPHSTGGNGQI